MGRGYRERCKCARLRLLGTCDAGHVAAVPLVRFRLPCRYLAVTRISARPESVPHPYHELSGSRATLPYPRQHGSGFVTHWNTYSLLFELLSRHPVQPRHLLRAPSPSLASRRPRLRAATPSPTSGLAVVALPASFADSPRLRDHYRRTLGLRRPCRSRLLFPSFLCPSFNATESTLEKSTVAEMILVSAKILGSRL
ncbi:hypothetical protein B0H12DRAFT_156735 [Mycena haematopus]|nr:hypothetical protein B0H12DRAFT_156735 [Mycena haematopus]